ncbi:8140_t:CDS:10 [Gigaspora rosea]|nr:8140_t:CDS:10 [Gigaspora rosea]
MTTQKSNRWIPRLPYFEKNKKWSLLDFLHWSIVFISDFGKKEEEHRRYKICLEQLAKSPELLKSHNNQSAQKVALRCLESYESEKKSFGVENFWKTKSSVVETLQRASTLNSLNIINRMADLHSDYNDALTNATRENIEPALKTEKTRNDETDSDDTISDDNNEEDLDEPEIEMVALSHKRKREVLRSLDNREFYSEFPQSEVNLSYTIQIPKVEMLKGLETKTRLEKYNIFCLFDVEFPYTKQLFKKLSTEQVNAIKSKWTMVSLFLIVLNSYGHKPQINKCIFMNNNEAEDSINKKEIEKCWSACSLKKLVDDYNKVIKKNVDENTFCTDFNSLMTDVTKQQFNNYEHQKNYELLWCQNLCTQLTLQLLRRHSALLDSSTSEYQYRDEIVNPLLASIFFDVDNALWLNTGEIENMSQKRQRNFLKQENERAKLGDKHDGILYMDIQGTPVEVGFLEVVGNAFTTAISDKNDDLEKLLKAMMLSLWYQHAHQFESFSENMTLQSFSILVFGREFHFLSMHFIDDMYIVDEFDAFVIPDSGMNFSQIGIIIEIIKKFKIRLIRYYRQLVQRPRRVTRFPKPGLPTDSQLKLKRNQKPFPSEPDEEF